MILETPQKYHAISIDGESPINLCHSNDSCHVNGQLPQIKDKKEMQPKFKSNKKFRSQGLLIY